jgi:hypothetical protein
MYPNEERKKRWSLACCIAMTRDGECCDDWAYQGLQVHVEPPGIILVTQQRSRSMDNPIALEKQMTVMVVLQDHAFILLLLLVCQESSACSMFENLTDALIGLCRTLKILIGSNLLADFLTLHIIVSLEFREEIICQGCSSLAGSEAEAQGYVSYLLGSNGLLACLMELLNGLLVVTQILLATNEDDGQAAAEMQDFGNPLWASTCQRFLIFQLWIEYGSVKQYLLLDVIE